MVVLCWLKQPTLWKNVVSNRVREIAELTNLENWRHLPSEMNPADLPSRGCNVGQLIQSQWWKGPDWLRCSIDQWPKSNIEHVPEVDSKRNQQTITNIFIALENRVPYETGTKYFTSFVRSKRMIAMFFRFTYNARKKNINNRIKGPLSIAELRNAEEILYRYIQKTSHTRDHIKNLDIIEENDLLYVETRVLNNPNLNTVNRVLSCLAWR
uniref:Uncharacterized protein n=1 Tax=Photinus pyralis TaxID=7054 RepID=A0A1Y1L0L8_PHOPY